MVASDTRFDSSEEWEAAVQSDNATKSRLRKKLFRKQREFDSSDDEIKCDVKEYKKRDRAAEWLVDVLLVRDYLIARGKPAATIDPKMRKAFPETYPLAIGFEVVGFGAG